MCMKNVLGIIIQVKKCRYKEVYTLSSKVLRTQVMCRSYSYNIFVNVDAFLFAKSLLNDTTGIFDLSYTR